IIDTSGSYVAKYTYDAWGLPITITDGAGNDVTNYPLHIANINPFRYKGYYFDSEVYLYYLNARYYDPIYARFISADGTVSTETGFLGYNMFAYCNNNPVMLVDSYGTRPIISSDPNNETDEERKLSFEYMRKYAGTKLYGAALPYVEMKGSDNPNTPNCYAYAIHSSVNEQPGASSGRYPAHYNDVYDVAESVKLDMKCKGYTIREIDGPYSLITQNEYRIALRVGTSPCRYNPYTSEPIYDYHFMCQTNTGQWAEKHGYGGSSILWDYGMTPDTIPWTLGGKEYYDSAIVYFAIGKEGR
ncbi:MAG: RHS repeat-associated core domain-containing protein, partial [Clostridia bacterium]|nr:RHS repeat-associated core domain-containing protein [Clostridia bacterium]